MEISRADKGKGRKWLRLLLIAIVTFVVTYIAWLVIFFTIIWPDLQFTD